MKSGNKDIHLISASQAQPFLEIASELGAPIERLAQKSSFMLDAALASEGVIGEFGLWRFIDSVSDSCGQPLLGYTCAERFPINSVEGLGGMHLRYASTLKRLLEQFFIDAKQESSASLYSLKESPNGVYLCREMPFGIEGASWQVELYMLTLFIQIVRLVADEDWLPIEMAVSSTSQLQLLPEEWQSVSVTWGSPCTALLIPKELMSRSPRATHEDFLKDASGLETSSSGLTISQFIDTQLMFGTPDLNHAAEEFGMSTATFKRRLRDHQLHYSALLEQARVAKAKYWLLNSDMDINEISIKLGYNHQANFTRAFTRATGLTPKQYRKISTEREKTVPD